MSTAVVHEEYHTNPNMPQLFAPPDVEARLQRTPRRQFIFRGTYRKSRASKRRVIRMLSVLVLEFFVCWTPLYVLHTWTVFDAHAAYSRVPAGAFAAVHLLAYVSSCCNPITYCFMHDKYRQAFRTVLACSSASSRRRRRWSSTKSHDRFVSLNSICSNGKNASGRSSLHRGRSDDGGRTGQHRRPTTLATGPRRLDSADDRSPTSPDIPAWEQEV
ncbi:hypothetical protein HPB50_019285 [Hyalomma asiaticum]|uniref:Uncharacterized protein n=1 Tax=Hyalomma asiaticum TaxID=266040 RepID=A0ACB7SRA2_HYAAI|nr:hypothetical protein HPB50_019285 [Hyalomma asiaticum]